MSKPWMLLPIEIEPKQAILQVFRIDFNVGGQLTEVKVNIIEVDEKANNDQYIALSVTIDSKGEVSSSESIPIKYIEQISRLYRNILDLYKTNDEHFTEIYQPEK
jgi:hypothetical protein